MNNFDDVKHFLKAVLTGLESLEEIEPLRERNVELETENKSLRGENKQIETLTAERDTLRQQLDKANEDFAKREEHLREEFGRELDKAKQRILDMQDDLNSREKDLRDEFNQQLDKANDKIAELDKARLLAQGTANFYRDTYSDLDEAYKIYLALDAATRSDLSGIFGSGESATGFFSGAVQESHLAPFWDYVSRRTDNEELSRLFDFCFDTFNLGFREAPYVRLQVDCGSYFDSDLMRRTSQSRQMGKVSRVLLQGYQYSSGNVVKKTIVELG